MLGVKDTEACVCMCVCEEQAMFSASSEERERPFKASKLNNFMLSIFFTKSKIMFLCFLSMLKARDIGEHHYFEIDASYY